MRLDLADIGNIYDHLYRLFPSVQPRVSTLVSSNVKKKKKKGKKEEGRNLKGYF